MSSFQRRGVLAAASLLIAPSLVRAPYAQTAPVPQIQTPGFYRFKVGAFTVTTVHDGFFARP